MTEVLLTATVLLCAVLVLRVLFRGRVPAGVQYGLWLLVAVRLLVPVSGVQSAATAPAGGGHSTQRWADPIQEEGRPTAEGSGAAPVLPAQDEGQTPGNDVQTPVLDGETPVRGGAIVAQPAQKSTLTVQTVLTLIWGTGAVAVGLWFVAANLRLHLRLRRARRPYPVENCPVPVYRADFLPSPCLVGLFKPTIYLDRAAADHPERLRHILTHELCHRRHGDNWWALVRDACLCLWWFHPLVWVAAVCSKRDCELFCDAAAVRLLGEEERIPYGETLISMVAAGRTRPAELFSLSTAMTEGKKQIQERVIRVSRRQTIKKTALVLTLALALLAGTCTLTSAVDGSTGTSLPKRVEVQPGLSVAALSPETVTIPAFDWRGTLDDYRREVTIRWAEAYGQQFYALPDGDPWKASAVAVMPGNVMDISLGQPAGTGETYRAPGPQRRGLYFTLAIRPVGGLDAVKPLFNGAVCRGTGEYADCALLEYNGTLVRQGDVWAVEAVAPSWFVGPAPTDPANWTDERIERWKLQTDLGVEAPTDDRAGWTQAGREWAESFTKGHLFTDFSSPLKADDLKLLSMDLTGWDPASPTEKPQSLFFLLKYQFRPIWGVETANRMIREQFATGLEWTQGDEYATMTLNVVLKRQPDTDSAWRTQAVQGNDPSNVKNGFVSPNYYVIPQFDSQTTDRDPVGVSVTLPAGTDETKYRDMIFFQWAAAFGQKLYHLPQTDPLYSEDVLVSRSDYFWPTATTASGAKRVTMGITGNVTLEFRPVNGQAGAAAALESHYTYLFEAGAKWYDGETDVTGMVATTWTVTLARTYNADGSVTWTCTGEGEPPLDQTPSALDAPVSVSPREGWQLSALDFDIIAIPDDGQGNLKDRWAEALGQEYYALPDDDPWKALDVKRYDAGGHVGLAIKPVGGVEAVRPYFGERFCPVGQGELDGYVLLQYGVGFRKETVDLFGADPVWVGYTTAVYWAPAGPDEQLADADGHPFRSKDLKEGWSNLEQGNFASVNVEVENPGELTPEQVAQTWSGSLLSGLRQFSGASNGSSPLISDRTRIVSLTGVAAGEADGQRTIRFTLQYAYRSIYGMDVAKKYVPDTVDGAGELAGYGLRTMDVTLAYRTWDDGRTPVRAWIMDSVSYRK